MVTAATGSPPAPGRGGLVVCGATSDAGKSWVVAGLCRLLARRGVRVAPFTVGLAEARERRLDTIADVLAATLDLDRLWALVESGSPPAA